MLKAYYFLIYKIPNKVNIYRLAITYDQTLIQIKKGQSLQNK